MFHGLGDRTKNVHPWSLTWNLRISSLEKETTFGNYDFRFYVKLWGCIYHLPALHYAQCCSTLLLPVSFGNLKLIYGNLAFSTEKHGLSSTESREFPKKKQGKSTTSTIPSLWVVGGVTFLHINLHQNQETFIEPNKVIVSIIEHLLCQPTLDVPTS